MKRDYRAILNKNGLTKSELAKRLGISRPALDSWIKHYDDNGIVPRASAQDIFDALFKEERNDVFETPKYKCLNNNIIVRIVEDTTIGDNGLKFTAAETRGKRDIVKGTIVSCANSNIKADSILYFSFYAAQPLTLDGDEVYVVNYADIKFLEVR